MDITQNELLDSFIQTRKQSVSICESLSDEDLQAQSMPDASPLKWHLAHTSWAFETFILIPHFKDYKVFDVNFEYLFNSYYNAIGAQFPRAQRGLLSRPDRQTILKYRQYIDNAIIQLIGSDTNTINSPLSNLVQLFVNHEQQHQELMLTDLKHLFFYSPLYPFYQDIEEIENCTSCDSITFEQGLYSIGHRDTTFHFDNECPNHAYYLSAFKLNTSLVSNSDYLEFIQDGGYTTPSLWLSEAWQKLNIENKNQPYYWLKKEDSWFQYTLAGLQPIALAQPVKHLNYFEANAFASWAGKRLPTEQEWEVAALSQNPKLRQMFNQLWQWTSSSYNAYPGFKAAKGAIGEYNGKFMVNQYVLKGGSLATPIGHIRASYRNFFYPDASWQFSGIRLAESV